MTKKIILLFLLMTTSLSAQEGNFSPYSFFGVGNNTFKGTTENRSMGGISMFSDSIHLNLQNPAAYSKLKLTNFSIGATANSLELEQGSTTDDINFSSVDYIGVGIPLNKFGVGFGLKPLSSVGYEIQSLEGDVAKSLNGRGGINTVYLSGGFNIIDNLSVGLSLNYNFGDIENKNLIAQNGIERSSREINSSDINGLTYNLGIQHDFKFKNKFRVRSSVSFSPESTLNINNERQLATIIFGNDGSEIVIDSNDPIESSSEVDFGSKINAGLGIGQDRKWFAGIEYEYQSASNFDAINFNNNVDINFIESSQVKLGGYFIPRYNAPRGYFNRIVYRAGLRYSETGLEFRGESIDEFGISFGVGLPAGRYFTNINFGAEYWMRGTTSNNLIQENYFSFFVSLSFNDLWFQKPKYN
ncbi:lipid outer membrane transport protein FadL-like protein [Mesohalobacter halotolerans]|uniref:Lipid outer membrane transport protein FadL-like protein n=1 Tax=Mesohalobacter halotolerans TaxID=1883405 RepID=A0A4U5TV31_9FLAO|nr:lipid outer membrane transport protein FadL-like protein [Mesohalobacter halotolerans]MBS3738887.1 lipid outer membrane transport protein FadL-like protein [Psychroflexus sp.]TKS57414.1 lipid outer membrane transport protein FadL-like protein [Mesohalobacter halotolerans]